MKEGKPYYATLNLHSNKKGILNSIYYSPEIEKFIIKKCIYKKPGDQVNYFSNAANALGIVFFHFPDQKTMIDMEEHMNDHIKVILCDNPE